MNENKLYTLKEIAEDLRVNYRTLLSCKDRFEDFVQGVPIGRIVKYPGELIDFFKLVFALLDEGYSTEKIRDLVLNGVQSEKDRFIETWLETWREALLIKRKKAGNGNNVIPLRQDQDDGMTGGQDDGMDGWTDDRMAGGTDGPMDGLTDDRMAGGTDGPMDGWTDDRMAGGTDGPMDGRTDEWMDGGTDGPMTGLTDGWMDDRMDGLMAGGLDDELIGLLDDRMTGGQDDGMTQYVVHALSEHADGPQKIHTNLAPCPDKNFTEQLRAFSENLSRILSETLTGIFQRMATENNIAITAICEVIEDFQQGIEAVDARLSALEEELGTETDDPIDIYRIEAGELQVSLPEIKLDIELPQAEGAPDPHGLAGIRQSIENGRPDREVVVQWLLTQRETQPPPSYKKLAGILNDAKIPTMSGRDAWSRSTLRNLAVRAEESQEEET